MIKIHNLYKSFAGKVVLRGVNLTIEDGVEDVLGAHAFLVRLAQRVLREAHVAVIGQQVFHICDKHRRGLQYRCLADRLFFRVFRPFRAVRGPNYLHSPDEQIIHQPPLDLAHLGQRRLLGADADAVGKITSDQRNAR